MKYPPRRRVCNYFFYFYDLNLPITLKSKTPMSLNHYLSINNTTLVKMVHIFLSTSPSKNNYESTTVKKPISSKSKYVLYRYMSSETTYLTLSMYNTPPPPIFRIWAHDSTASSILGIIQCWYARRSLVINSLCLIFWYILSIIEHGF